MRKTRFMSVLFLVLSAAFFFVPQFRQAFSLPIMWYALAGFVLVLAGAFFGWLRKKPEAAKA
jgi:LPXTG-motif cell wall-anchored protein